MVIFNKIVLCIVVLSLPLFSFSQQSDTLLKIPNNIIEINYSPKGLFSGNSLYLIKSTNSNSTNEIYKITPQYAIDASYNKLLTKNLKKVHQFILG